MNKQRHELVRVDEVEQPLFSEGLFRIEEFDSNIEGFYNLYHAIYKDYENKNIIHIWTSDSRYNTATELFNDIIRNHIGDTITDVYNTLTHEKNALIWIDALEGLSLEIGINDEFMEDQNIDIFVMRDIEVISRLISHKSSITEDIDDENIKDTIT